MRLRGRELYIIVGVVAVAVTVLWYFFLYSPKQKELGNLATQTTQLRNELTDKQQTIHRYEEYKKTAPQAQSALIRVSKMIPSNGTSIMPSFIIELKKTAEQSGLAWMSIVPSDVTTGGTQFDVQTIKLQFDGAYFDVQDFLYRLEDYVEYRNESFLVTGRLFTVTTLDLVQGIKMFPDLAVTMDIKGYQWPATPTGTAAAAGTGAK
jgi:hypothetical protein